MLEIIKRIFQNTAGSLSGNASNSALAEYYLSRLETSKSVVEVEAILSMNTLMTFNEDEESKNKESK